MERWNIAPAPPAVWANGARRASRSSRVAKPTSADGMSGIVGCGGRVNNPDLAFTVVWNGFKLVQEMA